MSCFFLVSIELSDVSLYLIIIKENLFRALQGAFHKERPGEVEAKIFKELNDQRSS